MKVCLFVAAAGLAACAVARPVEVGGLPAWTLADTEVSTNFPFRVDRNECEDLIFSLECAATPSNNVQVSFGRDANTNGVLDVEECGLTVGWDCGSWRLRSFGQDGWRALPVTADSVKTLACTIHVSKSSVKRLRMTENGVALGWSLPTPLPSWFYSPDWNMIRLSVRGIDAPDERFRARVYVAPTLLILR